MGTGILPGPSMEHERGEVQVHHLGLHRGERSRWLFSVDGHTLLRPKGPDTVFRYLGVWISMNLQWEKQRKMLNERIMSWRSIIIRNKVNSVKALTTVRDFLFPNLNSDYSSLI